MRRPSWVVSENVPVAGSTVRSRCSLRIRFSLAVTGRAGTASGAGTYERHP